MFLLAVLIEHAFAGVARDIEQWLNDLTESLA